MQFLWCVTYQVFVNALITFLAVSVFQDPLNVNMEQCEYSYCELQIGAHTENLYKLKQKTDYVQSVNFLLKKTLSFSSEAHV